MKRLVWKLFLCLCATAMLPVCAQDAVHYYFRTLDVRDGLSQNTVYQIIQDRKGFIWFGTKDGLNRYDGLSFRVYKKENSALGRNFITALYEDRQGNIWVGTFSGGLNRVNLRTNQVRHYSKGDGENTLVANDAFTLCRTTTGDLWIGTTSGLLKYNRDTDDFTRILQLKNLFTYDILEDFNGNLWFATFSNGLFCYNVQSREWKNYLSDEQDAATLSYRCRPELFFAASGGTELSGSGDEPPCL